MKDKKNIIIIISVIAIIVVGVIIALVLLGGKDNENKTNNNTTKEPEVVIPDAPAENTDALVGEMEKVEVSTLTNDVIEFAEDVNIEEGEKVAVWVYSTPKFLGYFDVVVEGGVKKIKGLEAAMKKIEIEPGEHNIAIVTKEGNSVGYIDVYIEDNKVFEDEKAAEESKYTTKEVKEEEVIKYQTTTKTDNTKKPGSKEVTQKGVNGVKEITYKVTYDEEGNEVSREKVSEKVTKNAVNEIVVVGPSGYNINTAKLTTRFPGFMCSESQTMEYDGQKVCDDSLMLPSFMAIAIDRGPIMVVTLDSVGITPITITKNGNLYVGTYNGQTYYFEARGGGMDPNGEPLTMEDCQKYNLTCSAW